MFSAMQKLISFVTIVAVMGFGCVAAYALGSVEPVTQSPAPHSSKVEADPVLPSFDVPSQTAAETVIVVKAPRRAKTAAKPRTWQCGTFRALENDAVQTVRTCEWL